MFRGECFVPPVVFGILLLTLSGAAQSDIPKVISYQGKVTDTGGSPVVDGSYNMRFWIYDAATGGAILWDSGAQSVYVSGGIFNVLLGESPQPMLDLDFDQDYWLLVRFNGVDQTPRQRLAATGYVYMASGLVPGTEVVGEVTAPPRAAIKGINTDTSGYTYGLYGVANSTHGYGIVGLANATTGTTYGVYGQAASSTGARGVYGWASSSFGFTVGVYGLTESDNGHGVHGYASRTTGTTYGIYGATASSVGYGVYGKAAATGDVNLGYGVWGENSYGNYGYLGSYGHGVYGYCWQNGTAVRGDHNSSNYGELGTLAQGVYGYGDLGSTGVRGVSEEGIGVKGQGGSGGVSGQGDDVGVYGGTIYGTGVYGYATASTGAAIGVKGESLSTDPGGYGVYYVGGLGGVGAMQSIVRTSQGPTGLDVITAAGNWVEDFGEGRLHSGRGRVELDALFLETVTIDDDHPMKVFVELGGACEGVYIIKDEAGFDVVELRQGSSSIPFDYRVVAKRKGFENKRLELCEPVVDHSAHSQ
jgi:hypothetical protein